MTEIAAPRTFAANPLRGRGGFGEACAWLLPIALIAYLGLNNGGYEAIERCEVGIILAWALLVITAAAAVPLAGGTLAGRVALAIMFALLVWTALSLTWTQSSERTMIEVARVGTYAAG